MKKNTISKLLPLLLATALFLSGCAPLETAIQFFETIIQPDNQTTKTPLSETELNEIYQQFLEADDFYYCWLVNTNYMPLEYESALIAKSECRVQINHESIHTSEILEKELYDRFAPSLAERFIQQLEPKDQNGMLFINGRLQAVDGWYYKIEEYSFEQISEKECLLHLKTYFPAEHTFEDDEIAYNHYTVRCTKTENGKWVFDNGPTKANPDGSTLYFR